MKIYAMLLTLVFPLIVNATQTEEIQTNAGPIVGIEENGLRIFKGIPYAAPPVGELRWKAPQPHIPWTNPLVCDQFGSVCPQIKDWFLDLIGDSNMSEDCLFLNIWTPAATNEEPLPVMVWIHGSAFLMGSGSQYHYEGSTLASEGVIVVTLNYRLGVFGFMVHPDLRNETSPKVAGNYGVLDQIAALQWVQDNIAQFGGDPDCVTVFGESAGASSVSLLLNCPLAQGLFDRAIVESGTLIGNMVVSSEANGSWKQAEQNGYEIQKRLGLENSDNPIEDMRAASIDDLLLAVKDMQFGPTMDGWCYPTTPRKMWDSELVNPVPLLLGINSDDGAMWADENGTIEDYMMWLDYFFGDDAESIFEGFPVSNNQETPYIQAALITHFMFGEPDRYLARSFGGKGLPVYNYYFSYIPNMWDMCYHGVEVEYVFGNVWEELGFLEADRELSKIMRRYWVNFAATGDPNGEGLPEWPQYELSSELQLHIGNNGIVTSSRLFNDEYDLIEQYAPRLVEDFPDISVQPSNCVIWELY